MWRPSRRERSRRWLVNVGSSGHREFRFEVQAPSAEEAAQEARRRYQLRTGTSGRAEAVREIP